MPTNTYEPGLALNATTMVPAANATGTLRTAAGAAAEPVFDLLGNPLASLTTNAQGYYPPFKADIALGVLDFGSIVHPVISTEVRDSGPEAAAARDAALAAQTAANDAKTAADASARAAADSAALVGAPAGSAIDAHLGGPPTKGRKLSAVKADGTDQTAVLQAELDALRTAGGGTLLLPAGTVTLNGTITLGNDGATPPKQPVLHLIGQGAHWSGRGTAPVGGTTLDITGVDTYGKVKTNGLGLLAVTGITFKDSAGTTTPFLYTTNTTISPDLCAFVGSKTGTACDQDAIVCGGTTNVEGAGGWNDGFQGYGTVISRNFFSGIRRAVYGRTFFNANVIRDNTVWSNCGHATGAAFDIDGDAAGLAGGSRAVGNIVSDNLIEVTNYKWGVRLGSTAFNTVRANGMFDKTLTTAAGVRCEANAENNIIIEGFTASGLSPLDDQATTRQYFIPSSGGVTGVSPPLDFPNASYPLMAYNVHAYGPGGFLFQPKATMPDSSIVMQFKRGPGEATNPGASVWYMTQNGAVVVDPTAVSGGNWTGPFAQWSSGGRVWSGVGTATGQTLGSSMSQDSGPGGSYFDMKNYAARFYDHNGGPLRMRIGASKDGFDLGAGLDLTVQRDASGQLAVNKAIKTQATTTAARPTAASVGVGGQIYDTTLNKPIWSDGTNWRDAAGTVV